METAIQSTETTIDHIGLVGRAIDPMLAAYRRLGFKVTAPAELMQPGPDGAPVPLGQVSAHAIFPDTYIELTAVLSPGQGNHLDNWLDRHEGLHILAFRSDDAETSWNELAAHGVVMPPMRAATREVNAGGKRGTADFKWYQLPDSIVTEGFACVVEHLTPELVFLEAMTDHPNGAIGLRGVGAVVTDMEEAFARYERLPGAERKSFAMGRSIVLRNQRITVVEAKGFRALFPGANLPEPPCFASYTVRVKDIGLTRAWLNANDVPYQVWGADGLWVKPEYACGAVLVFVDQRAPV
jgi:catechol 2,3-dioxygenase-like lactoylglutathione lyase family enzyme